MGLGNISNEFAYEFFMQIKKASEKEIIIKPKIKEVSKVSEEELPFIRNLTQKNPLAKPAISRIIQPRLEEKESAVEKIERLMEDSTVDSVECYGPGESIKIRRGERITESKVSLSEEEIKEIFHAAERERGKAVDRIFKTNFKNFILNGIKSKFIGSSFILEKKNSNLREEFQ